MGVSVLERYAQSTPNALAYRRHMFSSVVLQGNGSKVQSFLFRSNHERYASPWMTTSQTTNRTKAYASAPSAPSAPPWPSPTPPAPTKPSPFSTAYTNRHATTSSLASCPPKRTHPNPNSSPSSIPPCTSKPPRTSSAACQRETTMPSCAAWAQTRTTIRSSGPRHQILPTCRAH